MPSNKKRTKAQDLPKKTEQELTPEQAKRVQGGCQNNLSPSAQNVALGDGSVRTANTSDGTSNTILLPAVQKR